MMKKVYEVDRDGYIKEIYVANVDGDGTILDKDKAHLIALDPPHGVLKARWTSTKWVEGATQEELDELKKVELAPPTDIELLKQRLTITENALVDLILGGM